MNKGIMPHLKPEPFNLYFERWVRIYNSSFSKATHTHYENSLKHIEEYFQYTPIQEIRKSDYQEFLNDYGSTRVKDTVKKINSQIRSCVQEAMEEGIIHQDFTRKVILTGLKNKAPEEKYLNYHESIKLLKCLKEQLVNESGHRMVHYIILLALMSGMRFAK